jgi:hypothetical protein
MPPKKPTELLEAAAVGSASEVKGRLQSGDAADTADRNNPSLPRSFWLCALV